MVNNRRDSKKTEFSMRDKIAASATVTTLVGLIAVFGAAIKWR